MSKPIRIVLVVSLALNVLVVGVVLGSFLGDWRQDGPRRGGQDRALRDIGNLPFVMALEREDRAALAQEMGLNRDRLRANRDRLRDRFEAVLAMLRAEPFDPEALRALFARQRAALFERQQLGEDLLLARLDRMSVSERAAYADRLDRSLRRGPRNGPKD